MENPGSDVLPYRTDPEQLARWIEARARGRASAQLRDLDLASKTLEGTLATASALGFLSRESGELTPPGQRFALAAPAERRSLLRDALLGFEPFRGLLRDAADRPDRPATDAQWIETWWATHGFGSSQSNRVEATAVFGRLVDFVGWGRYIPGRRGHPTPIEWSDRFSADLAAAAAPPPEAPEEPRTAGEASLSISAPPPPPSALASLEPRTAPEPPAPADGYNRVVVPLRSGEVARIEVPRRLPREEKRRLVELLDLLISEETSRG